MFTNLCRLLREKLGDIGRGLGTLRLRAGPGHRHQGAARHGADPRPARALPGRDRRAGPRHQRRHRAPGRGRLQGPAHAPRLAELGDPALPEALALYAPEHVGPDAGAHMHRDSDDEAVLLGNRGRRAGQRRPQPADPAPALQRGGQGPVQRGRGPAARLAGARQVGHRRGQRIPGPRQDHPRGELHANRSATRRSPRWPRPNTATGATPCAS